MKINYEEVTIVTTCPFCGHANEVAVNEADYWDWQDGALIQDAFPYLSADEREMLISGICPACWEKDIRGTLWEDEDEEDLEDWEDDVDECGYNPYMGCYDFDC